MIVIDTEVISEMMRKNLDPAVLAWSASAGIDATAISLAEVETADAQIAAICVSRGATLATRNTSNFESTGIGLINPWRASPN